MLLYPQWVHIGIKLFSIQFFASWYRQLCQFIMDISSTVLHGREAGLATMSSGGQGIPGVCGEEQNQALREDLRPRHWSLPPADLSCRLEASHDNQDKSHSRQLSVLVVNILFVNIFCTLCIYSYNINHCLVIYLFIFYIWRLFFTIHKVTNAYLCELFSMVKSSYLRNKEPFFAYNETILGWSNPMKPVGLIIDLNKADRIWSS